MKNDSYREAATFVNQRYIDPEFWLFTDEVDNGFVPPAETRLNEVDSDKQIEVTSDEVDLNSVPDADEYAGRPTPVDPAAPPDEFHGTDLLNGAGNEMEKETDPS